MQAKCQSVILARSITFLNIGHVAGLIGQLRPESVVTTD